MSTPDSSQFDLITFDCYGTLIDWETGILTTLQPILSYHGVTILDDSLLELYGKLESRVEQGDYHSYRDVLGILMRQLSIELEFRLEDGQLNKLAESIRDWPPFPDTVAALKKLKNKFRLGIISNIDDDLFAASDRLLKIDFDYIVTAQQAQAYKPSLRVFEYAFNHIDIPRDRILHVAQSLYHDIEPCGQLGLKSVWVDRRKDKSSSGATPPSNAKPTWEVSDLSELAAMVEQE